jgi:uncharacterized membrane protein
MGKGAGIMPSIPQSLLWISLVVLWLFVLVPMLVSKRETVKRTSDVALATRVLNGGRGARLLRRRGPATGHFSDPDWQPSDEDLADHELDEDEPAPKRTVVLAAAAVAVAEPDYLDVEVIDPDTDALPVGASAAADAAEEPELELDLGLPAEVNPPTEAIRTVAEADFDTDDLADDELDELDEVDGVDDDADEAEGYDAFEGTDHDYEYDDESTGLEAQADDDVPVATSMAQARRRRYESTTAAAVSARKYKFRKRMLTAMTVVMAVLAASAYLVSPALWWVCGSAGIITLLYLGYLRRQTRIEERVRRRRAQRMMRSRLGVENTHDDEFEVVPSRLRRPGAVVLEIDDEDPVFEHLDYAPVADAYHLPRAAGQ